MKFSLFSKNFISQRPHPQKLKCLVWLVLASGGYQLLRWNGRTRKRERDLLAGTYVSLIAVETFIFLSVSCTLCMSRKYFGVFQDCSLLFSKLLSLSHTLTPCVCMCVCVGVCAAVLIWWMARAPQCPLLPSSPPFYWQEEPVLTHISVRIWYRSWTSASPVTECRLHSCTTHHLILVYNAYTSRPGVHCVILCVCELM